jgi:hypothetical protein
MTNEKKIKEYVKPEVEIVEFCFEDSIAESGQQGAAFFDEIWN